MPERLSEALLSWVSSFEIWNVWDPSVPAGHMVRATPGACCMLIVKAWEEYFATLLNASIPTATEGDCDIESIIYP